MEIITQFFGPQWGVDTGFRWVITVLALGIALYLSFRYSTEKSQGKVIDIQREQLRLLDDENKKLKERNLECEKQAIACEGEMKLLRVKTDLTSVMEAIKHATESNTAKYDAKFDAIQTQLTLLVSALANAHKTDKES